SVVREHELWRDALEAARGASVPLTQIKKETASRVYLRDETGKVAHRDVLAREWEIVQATRDGMGQHAPLPSVPRINGPAEGQHRRGVGGSLKCREFITLFRGGAGTGKSFVLRAVQQAIEGNKRRSVVLAPQRQQVIDLTRDGLIRTQTVRECLQRGDLPERG